MDDLEQRLATILREPTHDDEPPIELAGRIHRAVRVRRVRRRAALVAAACGVLALAVAVPVQLRGGDAATMVHVGPTQTVTPLPGSPDIAQVLGDSTPIPPELSPQTVGADGTVLGFGPDRQVLELGSDGTLHDLGIQSLSGLGTGDGLRTWTRMTGKAADQLCRDADGVEHVISPQGTDPARPIWVDHGVIVGSDVMRQPWFAKGCSGPSKVASTHDAVAFSYPTLFLVDAFNDKKLLEYDIDAAKVTATHELPWGVRVQTMDQPDQIWYAAATKDHFAWVADGVLRLAARNALDQVVVSTKVPQSAKGARMTAGNRLITYTTGNESVVLDSTTGTPYRLTGSAYAAGDWLVWSDGSTYQLSRVR
ncbi:hypothetical protein [Nonomuraea sediminis]|uniref:hypothetical protein n=1 Tax=Nonomuraea sediminis TaxID=2835864 RepID=UPI001BDD0FD4|nr:hypothetical protein [Nonomuraea sediminis]